MGAVVLVLVTLLTACGRGSPEREPGTRERTIRVDGVERTYRVHVPPGVRAGGPVVLVLHGGGGNGAQVEEQTGMTAVADRAGFVVVYPDGSGRTRLLTWNAGGCCAYARDNGVDDVAFVRVMIDALVREEGVDPARVYVTGFSNGAMLAYRLACELSDRIAAIAPVSGAMNVDPCTPARPVSVLAVHGTADPVVPFGGGPSTRDIPGAGTWTNASVDSAIAFWSAHDGCPGPAAGPCAGGAAVELVTVPGGKHAWPGGRKVRDAGDDPAPTPDASALIWSFFDAH